MSALSKVASFILLLDQKYHGLLAYTNAKASQTAYKAADGTFAKNRARATTLSVQVSDTLQNRLAGIEAQAAAQKAQAYKDRNIELDRVAGLIAQADDVRDKYIGIGAVVYAAHVANVDHITKLDDIRAGL